MAEEVRGHQIGHFARDCPTAEGSASDTFGTPRLCLPRSALAPVLGSVAPAAQTLEGTADTLHRPGTPRVVDAMAERGAGTGSALAEACRLAAAAGTATKSGHLFPAGR